jgi:hypothetical protein
MVRQENHGDAVFFVVSGLILPGDGPKFSELVAGVKKGIVVLEGPGGDLSAGLWIGSAIHTSGLSTSVFPGKSCASACALAWLGGRNRYMSETSHIGFHAAYREKEGVAQESGVANAKVGVYLSELGLPLSAVEFVTIPGPNEVFWLTKEDAVRVGIEVQLVDISAEAQPSPHLPQGDTPNYLGIARQAANAFRTQYKESGMSGIQDAVISCYQRAQQLKTERAAAYCYMLDVMGYNFDSTGQKIYGFPSSKFNRIEMVNARADKMFDLLGYDIDQRRKRTDAWVPLAYRALNEPFVKN